MPIVRAGPNEYLLIGRGGAIENRGSAVQAILRPGTIWVLLPSTKQEAAFEFTQETKDGIPLRFKGIIVYRITDPIAAAQHFDFDTGDGVAEITRLLTHVCLGELRHAVSHMTMVECIEQRKTTLSSVVGDVLEATIHGEDGDADGWGITVEVAQVAQVFIVDAQLRQQLEAEVRNEIKLQADQSNIRTQEEIHVAEMASEGRVQEQKLATDKDALRRQEEIDLAQSARQRRAQAEDLVTARHGLELDQEKFRLQLQMDEDRVNAETPVRLLKVQNETAVLREELEMRRLRKVVRELEVDVDLLLERARQDLRREMLPIEQAPQIVDSAARVLQGTNLSFYGEGGQLLGQLGPVFELLTRAIQQSTGAQAAPLAAVGASSPASAPPSQAADPA
jgi:hypothetical protein